MRTENRYYVYFHIRPDTGEIFYIGKGTNKRADESSGRNSYWTRTYKKYGRAVEIFANELTEVDAFAIEIEQIKIHNPRCNMSSGGEGSSGHIKPESARLAVSVALKGRKQDADLIERRTIKLRGKKRAEGFGDVVAARNRARITTDATRLKMSQSHTGRKQSDESIRKTSEWHKGKKRSEESRLRMSIGQKKDRILCTNINAVFFSLEDCAKWIRETSNPKALRTAIWRAVKSSEYSAYGFKWEKYVSA